jgi:sortase A
MAIGRLITTAPGDAWGPLPPHARQRSRVWRTLERLLLVVGLVFVGYFTFVVVETRLYQAMENRELDAILARAPATGAQTLRTSHGAGSMIGRIEIPRLGVSAIIRVGTDARTLRLAVGHIPGTAFPGEAGNVGLAGHRDTFFRRLRDVRVSDEIRVVTPERVYTFSVESTNIVRPSDTWVLDATPSSTLTLVTCYPFTYVGSAPDRFIVRALALSSQPASRGTTS